MKGKIDFGVLTLLAIYLIGSVIVVMAISYGAGGLHCWRSWSDSGINYRYGLFKGCQVQNEKGGWIPEDKYREVLP